MSINDLDGIANVQFGAGPASLTWETAADWDAAAAEAGVVHEAFGDLPGTDVIQLGYPSFDRGGSNLLYYWPIDEDSGGTVADVVGSNDGSVSGATQGVTGLHNTDAISGDGSNDVVDMGSNGVTGSSPRTTFGWVNLDNTSDGHTMFSYGGTSGEGSKYVIQTEFDTSGELTLYYRSGGHLNTGLNMSSGTWQFVGHTFESDDTSTLYLGTPGSGLSSDATSLPNLDTDAGATPIGLFYDRVRTRAYLPGDLDNWRHYDRALSSTEMQAAFDAGTGGHLESATKSFGSPQQPDLQNLAYSLNGESITLEVIGSPSGTSETVSQVLDGSTSYTLSWSNSHTDFRVKPVFSTSSVTVSPTFSRAELSA